MLHTMGEPLARKQAPRSAYEAKFSGPYTVASALIGGGGLGIGIDDFSDTLVSKPRRCALMSRIGVKVDARCDEVFPDQAPAILTVQTTGGDILEEIVMVNRGSAERSLADAEIAAEFTDNAKRMLPDEAAIRLRASIDDLVAGADLTEVVAQLRMSAQ